MQKCGYFVTIILWELEINDYQKYNLRNSWSQKFQITNSFSKLIICLIFKFKKQYLFLLKWSTYDHFLLCTSFWGPVLLRFKQSKEILLTRSLLGKLYIKISLKMCRNNLSDVKSASPNKQPCMLILFLELFCSFNPLLGYVLDVLWGQPIKFVQVAFTSELHETELHAIWSYKQGVKFSLVHCLFFLGPQLLNFSTLTSGVA